MNHRIAIDWPACRGRGLCFEILPERVALDEWGYPIVTGEVTPELLALARETVRACPTLAVRLFPARV